jgi:hypothetical protein
MFCLYVHTTPLLSENVRKDFSYVFAQLTPKKNQLSINTKPTEMNYKIL